MGFIMEKISKEERQKYGFEISPDRWAIDRENNMFLINVGGFGRTSFTKFELHIGSEVVKIVTDSKLLNDPSINCDTIFNIDLIHIPMALKPRIDEIKLAICESLKKYGFFGNAEAVGKITVNLPADSRIYFI